MKVFGGLVLLCIIFATVYKILIVAQNFQPQLHHAASPQPAPAVRSPVLHDHTEPAGDASRAIATSSGNILRLSESACLRPARWGSYYEGGWSVCLDHLTPHDCVVYSFGINDNWSFDSAAERYGCEVHGFDPSVDFDSVSLQYTSANKTLHQWGLSLEASDSTYQPGEAQFDWPGINFLQGTNSAVWHMRTILSSMHALGHERIDVIKIDVEGAEWGALEALFETGLVSSGGISQLLCEFHFDPAVAAARLEDRSGPQTGSGEADRTAFAVPAHGSGEADRTAFAVPAHSSGEADRLHSRYQNTFDVLGQWMHLWKALPNGAMFKTPWDGKGPQSCCGEFSYVFKQPQD